MVNKGQNIDNVAIACERPPTWCLRQSRIYRLLKLKFIYSEKATKFCEIFPLLLSYVVPVKSKGKILQKFVAFSEYMNFNHKDQSIKEKITMI